MKSFIKIILLLLSPAIVMAQQYPFYVEPAKDQVDSLRLISKNTSNDTLRMTIFRDLGRYYLEIERDSTLYYSEQRLLIAKRLKLKLWEADAFEVIGYVSIQLGNYPKSLQALLQALKIAEDEESEKNIYLPSKFTKDGNPRVARLTSLASIHTGLGQLYEATGNIEKQLANYFEARNIGEKINDKSILSVVNRRLGSTYIKLNKLDSETCLSKEDLL